MAFSSRLQTMFARCIRSARISKSSSATISILTSLPLGMFCLPIHSSIRLRSEKRDFTKGISVESQNVMSRSFEKYEVRLSNSLYELLSIFCLLSMSCIIRSLPINETHIFSVEIGRFSS